MHIFVYLHIAFTFWTPSISLHGCLHHAFYSLGRGHRLATVLARVPPKPLPPAHPGQRLSKHQTSPRYVYAWGEPRCSSTQTGKVPLEKHHPSRVSVLTKSRMIHCCNTGSYTVYTQEMLSCGWQFSVQFENIICGAALCTLMSSPTSFSIHFMKP